MHSSADRFGPLSIVRFSIAAPILIVGAFFSFVTFLIVALYSLPFMIYERIRGK